MEYFKREELVDILKTLMENPKRETLKKINERYNIDEVQEKQIEETSKEEIVPIMSEPVLEAQNETVSENFVLNQNIEPKTAITSESSILPSIEMTEQSIIKEAEEPAINDINYTNNVSTLPSLEVPSIPNVQNNNPINFSGNLFEPQAQSMENLMQTTDNFNMVQNPIPTTEVPVAGAPFFGSQQTFTNNQIPVSGPINENVEVRPSMFGQMQQNYM